jgi:SAM-dependent methyltransferase
MESEIPGDAWGKIDEAYVVELRQCSACSFEFFDPSLAGGEAFYQSLDRPEYYTPFRPEFERTVNFAQGRGLRRLLDVGCGRGDFLDYARQAGLETSGVELNSNAATMARSKGHQIFTKLLHELDPAQTGRFDLITLFQVLEHVPEPGALMKQAAAFLNPGGHISVAVPSAEGMYRFIPWEPAQWPPHHVSRWRLKDFRTLAAINGLELVGSGGDVLLGSKIEHVWNIHNRLAPVLGRRPRWGGEQLPRLLSAFYRKTGMKFFFPHWGTSIYGYFRSSLQPVSHG